MFLHRSIVGARSLVFAVLASVPLCASAREIVYLNNGFTLEADSHTPHGQSMLVRTSSGTLEVPVSTIEHIDPVTEPVAETAQSPGTPALQTAKRDLEMIIASAASAQGLAPSLVRSVAKIESNLRQDAVSPVGAIGLMQLMPGTAADLGVSAKDAEQNAAGGALYLRQLLLQYHGDAALALAAYNAGPAAVAKYHGVPPYGETRRYIVKVLQEYIAEQNKTEQKKAQTQLLAKSGKAGALSRTPAPKTASIANGR